LKNFDKYYAYSISLILISILGIIVYFLGYENVHLTIGLCFFRGIMSTSEAILVYQFTPDCAEYGMYLTGNRAESASFALQTLIANATTTIRSALSLFATGLFGFE
jgi:Na+/melibiose symporter-like transporter